jgi:hypothetical protein
LIELSQDAGRDDRLRVERLGIDTERLKIYSVPHLACVEEEIMLLAGVNDDRPCLLGGRALLINIAEFSRPTAMSAAIMLDIDGTKNVLLERAPLASRTMGQEYCQLWQDSTGLRMLADSNPRPTLVFGEFPQRAQKQSSGQASEK